MHTKRIYKNVLYSFFSRIILLIIGFASRKIFLDFLGEELVGLSSLYSNLLDLLNMSELGIGTAVQFQLFDAIAAQNTKKINQILYEAKKIYYTIGGVIFLLSIVMTFGIEYLIKENTFSPELIRISFLMYAGSISLSYFLVHKRLFLQTNEELYVVNTADTLVNIAVSVIKIGIVVATGSYFLYVGLTVVQTVASNVLIHMICRKRHPKITGEKPEDGGSHIRLQSELRYVVPLKLSNYIYRSTDNLVISRILGLVSVALYSNYMLIINYLMIFYNQLMNIVQISLGVFLNEIEDREIIKRKIETLRLGNYFISSFCSVEIGCLLPFLIRLWLGNEYVLPYHISWLLAVDMFFFMEYQPLSIVYNISGKFREDRNITFYIAICNIVISIAGAFRFGIAGVVLGTLLSDMLSYLYRTYKILVLYFEFGVLYCLKIMVWRFIGFLLILIAGGIICRLIHPDKPLYFINAGLMIGVFAVLINSIMNYKKTEFTDMIIQLKKAML